MAQPLSFTFNSVAQEVICGSDAISGLPAVLDRLGATRAMVTCGPSILEKSDVIQRVQAALGDRFVGLFSGVSPHSPVHTLDEAMLLAADVRPDISWSALAAAAPTTPPRALPPYWAKVGESTTTR